MPRLLLVYNADSGTRNAILDSIHKVFSPSTYECNLCDITYGLVSENRVWKKFRKERGGQLEFLHRDEFKKLYASKFGAKFTFPIVLLESHTDLEVFIATDELYQLQTASELVALVEQRIKNAPLKGRG
ncbi:MULTISPECIES: GTPase [Flavobacteriaceae]|uniref:GTPase n=1 Tax=Flavobacteriaceae TaxID=49546 RepID=UPI00234AB169|nr:GTPase [Muricauda sp. SP22]MDC6361314.1 GTPase [Muricauda sp. SP22]